MSNLSLFLKKNKTTKENAFYPATTSLCDEEGKPLLWEVRALSTKENDEIRDSCMYSVPLKGKRNVETQKFDATKYTAKMLARSVVNPDLYNKELQDSYGVFTPEELIVAMVDNPGEYTDFSAFVQELNGFTTSLEDEVEKAKN